ncbi:hypothetical protein H8356DRAFT_1341254 [Neocallimastix lanati (nom. inval.)]|nr:hypothetical protein H8356DRAFT_1341254 [Neocallimastix sp. JGI-2020a]
MEYYYRSKFNKLNRLRVSIDSYHSLLKDQRLHGKSNFNEWKFLIDNAAKRHGIKEFMEVDVVGKINGRGFIYNLNANDVTNRARKASNDNFDFEDARALIEKQEKNKSGKAKATKNTLISFCCKLKDRITLRENDEFISAVPSYTHFLTVKNLPFIVVESPEYMFSIGKMAQRKYKIPIDRTEEFFPTDYQKDQDQPGNNSVINSTIKAKMQTQLLAEERNKQEIFRSGNTLEEMAEPIENNLETLHPRRIVGDISPTSWEETRVGSTASRENEEFCRRMRINESIIDANNFYEGSSSK